MAMKPSDDIKLGELLVRNRLISEEQLEHALLVQQVQGVYKPLGEVCRDLGYLTRTNLRGLLDRYGKRMHLGSLLLKMGVISELTLRTGLAARQATGEKLGEVLVRKSFITQPALRAALGIQLTIPTVPPDPHLIDKSLLDLANANFFKKKRAIPIRYKKEEGVVTVAMDDPLDVETITDLEKVFKCRIEPAMLSTGETKHLLEGILDPWSRPYDPAASGKGGTLKFTRSLTDTITFESE